MNEIRTLGFIGKPKINGETVLPSTVVKLPLKNANEIKARVPRDVCDLTQNAIIEIYGASAPVRYDGHRVDTIAVFDAWLKNRRATR